MRFKITALALLAEFIGTYALVLFGCGAIILSELENFPSGLIPLIFGVTINLCLLIGQIFRRTL